METDKPCGLAEALEAATLAAIGYLLLDVYTVAGWTLLCAASVMLSIGWLMHLARTINRAAFAKLQYEQAKEMQEAIQQMQYSKTQKEWEEGMKGPH